MKKTLTAMLLVFVLIASLAMTVSAATIADVVTALEGAGVPDVYVTQAESWLTGKALSSAQLDGLLVHINAAKTAAAGETQISELSSAQRIAIRDHVLAAATELGLTATYTNKVLTIKDGTATVFEVSYTDAVKQTGYDYSIILIGLGVLVMAAAAAFGVRKALHNR